MTSITESLSAADAIARVESGAGWLLDVREDVEWQAGHAPDAHHIPMGEIGCRQEELPADETILVICHAGSRSRVVADALLAADYPAANVEGGMDAWHAAGGPVVR